MVLVNSARFPEVEPGEKAVDYRRTIGVKIIADGRNSLVANDHRLLVKVVIGQTHSAFCLYCTAEEQVAKQTTNLN